MSFRPLRSRAEKALARARHCLREAQFALNTYELTWLPGESSREQIKEAKQDLLSLDLKLKLIQESQK